MGSALISEYPPPDQTTAVSSRVPVCEPGEVEVRPTFLWSTGSVADQTGREEHTREGNVAKPLKRAAYHEVGNPRQKRAVLAVELRHPVVIRALHAAPTPVVTVS